MVLVLVTALVGCSSQSAQPSQADQPKQGEPSKEQTADIPKFVSIVGASSGGTFFLVANGMAQLFNEKMPSGQYSAQSTAGTPAIFKALNAGDGEIGFGQSSMAADALKGEGKFEGNQINNMLGMSYMFPNVMHLVVNKNAGIKTPEDMKGKRIGVGEAGGGVEIDSRRLFQAMGMDLEKDIKPEFVTGSQATDLLRNNQIDAAIMPGGLGASAVVDILSSDSFELIAFPEEVVAKVIEINPAYFAYDIPANTYPNQAEMSKGYAEANWLFARADLSEDFVYQVLTVLYENQEAMANVHNSMKNMSLENSQNGKMIPLHPGAEKFFKEKGIEVK